MYKTDGRVRYTMTDLRRKYPDKWVVLDDCDWVNKATVESGVLIEVCDDSEIEDVMVECRREGKGYMFRRTTEDVFNPLVQSLNYEVTT